ncbi:class I lanthipeptide [Chitinophaga nivalis]|uniref:Class I lanthipeptide n=1 Tax=Chitinophaga nivalis TaxID=2991709 RepID=A0ABT3INI3_9BACT|nr:class I lanthipeptide [Chitinophaga nivalis]MCW3464773.1 class I lanthipeptide [Chitinophaga nivalis]MCW3485536.1 class I lanthipeptide [Chitinophaga nivalis]
MKKQNVKKISLKKINIATLNPESQQQVNGGGNTWNSGAIKSCFEICVPVVSRLIYCPTLKGISCFATNC